MTTTLSVVVPVRDVARYVPDLLRSLLHNTRRDFEFLVVDDASRDRTAELVAGAGVPGLRLIRHPAPLGPGAARNTGLAQASGRYLTYLDGDDWIRPGYLAELVAAISGLGCDFVIGDHIRVTGRRRQPRRPPQGRLREVLDPRASILPVGQPSMVDYPYCWAGVYDRRLAERGLLDFAPGLHTAEDRPWFWRLYRQASSYAVVPLRGVFYRRHREGALTRIGDERQLHFFDAFDLVLAELAADPEAERFAPKAVRGYFAVIGYHLTRRARLSPPLRVELVDRARAAMLAVPPELRAEVLPAMGVYRQELFEELLGVRI
ncbi:glycosyltransferase family 2 protein [Actinocorallia libanotica]|uniref:Glycosyltransferase family 2 protein n=1 Tax=Actinocorallia libanotica TaxID=46162 RepID=A0ABN1RWN8_9ACTN